MRDGEETSPEIGGHIAIVRPSNGLATIQHRSKRGRFIVLSHLRTRLGFVKVESCLEGTLESDF